MAEPLSIDLRKRVVDAVNGGMSRRQAAAHFRVGVSSAIRWVAQVAGDGRCRAQAARRRSSLGGDRGAGDFRSFPCSDPDGDATLPRCAAPSRPRAIPSAFRRFGASSPAAASRSKKVCARGRARSPRYPEAPSGMVRRPTRSRSRRSSSSSTRPGPPRTWRDDTGALRAASACAPPSPMAIGKRRPSSPACGSRGSSPRSSSMGRSTPRSSKPMSSNFSPRRCGRATSWSWTICRATRRRKVATLIEAAHAHLALPAALQPRLQSHREMFSKLKALLAKSRNAPSTASGAPSPIASRSLRRANRANYFEAAGYEPTMNGKRSRVYLLHRSVRLAPQTKTA